WPIRGLAKVRFKGTSYRMSSKCNFVGFLSSDPSTWSWLLLLI
ncbi:unnamed protein product, partial [Arabidopsis halleri]